ncbi:MAG: tRNA-dihydrouridine synthase family protein [Candidatus Berkelbacteria bacterium]
MNIWREIKKPIKVLAPMAGYTDSAFRQLCRACGADLVMTELVSADAIYHKSKYWYKEDGMWLSRKGFDETLEMLQFAEAERPIIVQLFGKYPEKFAFAADWLTKNLQPDGIDINMGCPARKVVNSDHGAALLKNPELAAEIVRAVKSNTTLPVSVKTRLGWDNINQILEFAPVLVTAGIDALTVHARTYKMGFSGTPEWSNIYEVKKMFGDDLVVIGNGGIKNTLDLETRISDLDGVAIGQAAIGAPWIFSDHIPSKEEIKTTALKHASFAFEAKGEKGMLEYRKHLLHYLRRLEAPKALRLQAVEVMTLEQVQTIFSHI